MLYKTIVFLPLIAFLITGLFGRSLGDKLSQFITSGFVTISAVLSWVAFYAVAMNHGGTVDVHVLSWVSSGTLNFNWALHIDTLTAVMLVVVFCGLYEPRPRQAAVLCLFVAVYIRYAYAGYGG